MHFNAQDPNPPTGPQLVKLDTYQDLAAKTAIYPVIGHQIVYPALGLAGEAGEVAEKVKKMFRDDGGIMTEKKRIDLAKEISDCLWYVSELARSIGFTLSEIATMNIEKLDQRQKQGKLNGSGDDREEVPFSVKRAQ